MPNGMYTTGYELILNACEGALQIALTENEQPVCFEEWFAPKRATEILAPALGGIFQRTGIGARDLRRIGCMAGPGSFTGIRLVLATAAALRRVTQAKLASLNYLQSLATTAVINRNWLYPGLVVVLVHARRNLLHFQPYQSFGPQIPAQPLAEVQLVTPEAALNLLPQDACLVCGSGLGKYCDIFASTATGQGAPEHPKAQLLPRLLHPSFAALRLLGRHGDYFDKDVEPNYVRGCDAVENLEAANGADAPELIAMRELLSAPAKSEL